MRCDDFICLGRTVPEESKKYGTKVCMAGLSKELGSLMRVYPLPVDNPIHARHQYVLELTRNHRDNRRESWKLFNPKGSIFPRGDKPELSTEQVKLALAPFIVKSIEELNDRRMSLGVLELMGEPRGSFRSRNGVSEPDQGMLFEITDECFGANAIDLAPYIEFWDQTGKRHDLQIREWGCYEWLRKHRDEAAKLWSNLRLDGSKPIWAVLGNQANRRTSWLIIKTFAVPMTTQQELFA